MAENRTMNIKQTIAEMLTENTGTHLLDSGGAYGRNWEKNTDKTVEAFENEPSATVEISFYKENEPELIPTVSVFHKLTKGVIELDDLCAEFNTLSVDGWNSDYYGVSSNGFKWLEARGFVADGEAWNTYNWENNFSQVLQGIHLDLDGEKYVLIQIHGGCDVRGGYTDAKLFKVADFVEPFQVVMDDCGFSVEDDNGEFINISWHGEWVNEDGSCADDEYLALFAKYGGATMDKTTIVAGDVYQ